MAQKSISITYTANVSKAITSLTKLENKLKKIDKLAKSSSFNINVKGANGSKGNGSAKEQIAEAKAQVQLAKAQEAQAKAEVAKLKVQEQQVKQSQAVVKLQAAQAKFEHEQGKYKVDSVKAQGTPVAEAHPTVRTGLFADDYGDRNQRAQDYIDSLSQQSSRATVTLKSLATTLNGTLKGALTAAKTAVVSLGSALGSLAKSAFSKLTSSVKNSTKGLANLFNSLKRIAMYRALRSAIKTITDGFNQGVENAYRWAQVNNNQLAASLDSLSTSSLYLKNSIGAMAAPLINMLAPAIATVVDWVVTLINALNRLFAMLGGQGTWIKATKQATNYKDAVGGASKALKSFTIGIDELNILEDNGGGGGGGASADAGGMFEEVALGASSLRDAITNGEWMKVGELIAESINDSIAKIDTKLLGTKIGDKIENAIELSYGFLKKINTRQIGQKIADFLDSGLQEIDTNLLGKTLAEKWNRTVDLFLGFVENFNFEQAATKFTDWIRGIFTNFNPENLATAINTAVHGIFTFLVTTIETYPFEEMESTITDFFKNIDWDGIGQDIGILLSKAVGFAFDTLSSLLDVANNLLSSHALSDLLSEVITSIDYVELGLQFAIVVSKGINFGANLINELISSALKTVGIDAFDEIADKISYNLEQDTAVWEELLVRYQAKTGEVSETTESNVEKMRKAVVDKYGEVAGAVFSTSDSMSRSSESMVERFGKSREKYVVDADKVATITGHMRETSNSNYDSMKNNVVTNLNLIGSENKNTWTESESVTSKNITAIQNEVTSGTTNASNAVIESDVKILGDTEGTWTKVEETIDKNVNDAGLSVSNVTSEMETDFDNLSTELETTSFSLRDIFKNIGEWANGAWQKVDSFISDMGNLDSFSDFWHYDVVGHFTEGRATGGFMDSGQVYTVREGGIPEYVGRYGNRAAVANNDQIVEGIAGGVSVANEEVVAALNTLIGVVSGMDLSVNIGDKEIGQANERYTQSRGVYVNRGSFAGAY